MATKPKLMLFSHVCNTRSITGAEKLLLHFMREMGSIFDCVLVAPQKASSPDLRGDSTFRSRYARCPCFTVCTHPTRALPMMQNSFDTHQLIRTWFLLSGNFSCAGIDEYLCECAACHCSQIAADSSYLEDYGDYSDQCSYGRSGADDRPIFGLDYRHIRDGCGPVQTCGHERQAVGSSTNLGPGTACPGPLASFA